MKIHIVCIGIENPGNLGAIARAMKNFNFRNLVLVDPVCDPKCSEAVARAKHAGDILKKARVSDLSILKKFDHLVGTTSVLGTDYNIPRSPITPEELSRKTGGTKGSLALVFGPEGAGLSNELMRMMDYAVTIPTHRAYPALNLSHSVSILLYELYKQHGQEKIGEQIEPCSRRYKDVLLGKIDTALERLDFPAEEKAETQKAVWKRIIGKSMPTKREAFALLGFFSRVNGALSRLKKRP